MIDSYATRFLLGITILLFTYLIWMFYNSYQYWKRKGVPYLTPTIPFGNVLDLYMGKITISEVFSNAYLEFKKRGEKHGGIYYIHQPIYIPVDINIIKKIVISDAHNFSNHGFYIDPKNDILSNHLFNIEDGRWREIRSKLPSAFTTAKMKQMFLTMQKMVDPLKVWLDDSSKSGEPLDIKNVMGRFTTDIVTACTLGINTNTLKEENEEFIYHNRQLFDYQFGLYKNTFVITIPRNILLKFKFKVFTKYTEKYITDFFTKIYKNRKQNGVFRNDLTDTLMKLTERREEEKDFNGKNVMEPLSIGEFCSQMFFFIATGFETSSSAVSFGLYELSKNPDCQIKLRNEINDVLAKHDNKITYDAVMDMKYLDQVVSETLRLYPSVPIVARVCKNDYPIPGTDFTLPKGSFVMITNVGIHRDPEYFPNPLQFDPERWTYENKLKRPAITNLAFGEGPRICIGKRFGILQTKLGLLSVIKDYEVNLNDKTTKGFKFVSTELIPRKTGGIWLNIKKITK